MKTIQNYDPSEYRAVAHLADYFETSIHLTCMFIDFNFKHVTHHNKRGTCLI